MIVGIFSPGNDRQPEGCNIDAPQFVEQCVHNWPQFGLHTGMYEFMACNFIQQFSPACLV